MVNINMGERLKSLRQARRLTLKQVSELVGVSVSVLSAYEVEDRHPSYHILLKLATLYDVSCDYLIGKDKMRTLNVNGLSEREINSLAEIIDIMKANKK
ncbi:MAG: helix-turn-helix transcriptional regulator [Eubacterium sp.]|nr:helix-turn-helix transcriptional regulator [Eubacterium sp.]